MKRLMALMALMTLTACDYAVRNDLRNEREDRVYREAMDDYRAGRMDAAIAGLEKAVRNDPSNASARFQLACLQQDLKKDFLSAYCGYPYFEWSGPAGKNTPAFPKMPPFSQREWDISCIPRPHKNSVHPAVFPCFLKSPCGTRQHAC